MLTKKELADRVRKMFDGEIPIDWKLTVSAVDFDRKDIEEINAVTLDCLTVVSDILLTLIIILKHNQHLFPSKFATS